MLLLLCQNIVSRLRTMHLDRSRVLQQRALIGIQGIWALSILLQTGLRIRRSDSLQLLMCLVSKLLWLRLFV